MASKTPRSVITGKPKRPRRIVRPDPDYVTQQEEADGQKWKRRAAADRGKPVKPPHHRFG